MPKTYLQSMLYCTVLDIIFCRACSKISLGGHIPSKPVITLGASVILWLKATLAVARNKATDATRVRSMLSEILLTVTIVKYSCVI